MMYLSKVMLLPESIENKQWIPFEHWGKVRFQRIDNGRYKTIVITIKIKEVKDSGYTKAYYLNLSWLCSTGEVLEVLIRNKNLTELEADANAKYYDIGEGEKPQS